MGCITSNEDQVSTAMSALAGADISAVMVSDIVRSGDDCPAPTPAPTPPPTDAANTTTVITTLAATTTTVAPTTTTLTTITTTPAPTTTTLTTTTPVPTTTTPAPTPFACPTDKKKAGCVTATVTLTHAGNTTAMYLEMAAEEGIRGALELVFTPMDVTKVEVVATVVSVTAGAHATGLCVTALMSILMLADTRR